MLLSTAAGTSAAGPRSTSCQSGALRRFAAASVAVAAASPAPPAEPTEITVVWKVCSQSYGANVNCPLDYISKHPSDAAD